MPRAITRRDPRGWGIRGIGILAVSACDLRHNAPRSPPPARSPQPRAASGRAPKRRPGWRQPWGRRGLRHGAGSCDGAWAGRPRGRDRATSRLILRPRQLLDNPPGSWPGRPPGLSAGGRSTRDDRPAAAWAHTNPAPGVESPWPTAPGDGAPPLPVGLPLRLWASVRGPSVVVAAPDRVRRRMHPRLASVCPGGHRGTWPPASPRARWGRLASPPPRACPWRLALALPAALCTRIAAGRAAVAAHHCALSPPAVSSPRCATRSAGATLPPTPTDTRGHARADERPWVAPTHVTIGESFGFGII